MSIELLNEIESAEVETIHEVAAEAFMSKFTYTTQALSALSLWLETNGDAKGAQMILEFAGEFAKHEAETV